MCSHVGRSHASLPYNEYAATRDGVKVSGVPISVRSGQNSVGYR